MYGGALYDEITIAVKDSLTYASKSLRARSYASHPLESQLASGDERGIFSPTVRFDIHSCTLGFWRAIPWRHHRHVSTTKKTHRGVR